MSKITATLIPLLLLLVTPAPRARGAEFKLTLPLGLDEKAAVIPEDNPLTPEKIALGKKFFWDKRWSTAGNVACVTCHDPGEGWSERVDRGWSDPRQLSASVAKKPAARRTPTIINRLFSSHQLWTGLRASLEDHALHDANKTDEVIVRRLGAIPAYQSEFRKAFGTDLTPDGVAKAIAAYVRTILSGNSPYDRFRAGDSGALSAAAQRGLTLFEGKARCNVCHAGFNLTDERYHNTGVGMDRSNPDLGRYTVTNEEKDKGVFKTPTLRDVERRGPYMHDASLKSLPDVVSFYNRGGTKNPWLSSEIRPLDLTGRERADLVLFLEALSGEISPEVSRPPALPK